MPKGVWHLTVEHLETGKTKHIEASARQVLVDHLYAAAARWGYEVVSNLDTSDGYIYKGDNAVAAWEIF